VRIFPVRGGIVVIRLRESRVCPAISAGTYPSDMPIHWWAVTKLFFPIQSCEKQFLPLFPGPQGAGTKTRMSFCYCPDVLLSKTLDSSVMI
jgi:hypothetical protein